MKGLLGTLVLGECRRRLRGRHEIVDWHGRDHGRRLLRGAQAPCRGQRELHRRRDALVSPRPPPEPRPHTASAASAAATSGRRSFPSVRARAMRPRATPCHRFQSRIPAVRSRTTGRTASARWRCRDGGGRLRAVEIPRCTSDDLRTPALPGRALLDTDDRPARASAARRCAHEADPTGCGFGGVPDVGLVGGGSESTLRPSTMLQDQRPASEGDLHRGPGRLGLRAGLHHQGARGHRLRAHHEDERQADAARRRAERHAEQLLLLQGEVPEGGSSHADRYRPVRHPHRDAEDGDARMRSHGHDSTVHSNQALWSGLRCSNGQCVCDPTSCPSGCCCVPNSSNGCLPGTPVPSCLAPNMQTDTDCGTGGIVCQVCVGGSHCDTSNGTCGP